jgi:hypothetical protein
MTNKKPFCLCMNGPPGSGKDEAGKFFSRHWGASILKFAEPLERGVQAIYEIDPTTWFGLREPLKDSPAPELLGKTCRQTMIGLSEDYMKKLHGPEVFGRFAVAQVRRKQAQAPMRDLVFTDCGFAAEFEFLKETIGDHYQVVLVRIARPDHDFTGDSRGYIPDPDWRLGNSGDLAEFKRTLGLLADYIRRSPKWSFSK